MPEFVLYRAHVTYFGDEGILPFVPEDFRPPEVLREAISRATGGFPERRWQVGNVEEISRDGIYLALGRRALGTLSMYDEDSRGFVDMPAESAPYTHVLVNIPLELVAIARNTRVSLNTDRLARQLARILTDSVENLGTAIELLPVKDPQDFVARLENAYAVTSFTLTFRSPNAWDVQRQFIRPAQELVNESGAYKGSATLTGDDLERSLLKELSKSAASTGDDVKAKVRHSPEEKPVRIQLKKDAILFRMDDVASEEGKRTVLETAVAAYEKVRR